MEKNRSTNAGKKGNERLEKYVPPAIVDHGTIAKITSAPKSISGPDSKGPKKGSCL